MAYKKSHVSELPRKARRAVSQFEYTAEWKLLKADLEKGLRPTEAISIALTEDDKTNYGIRNRRTIARFIQKYLKTQQLPYTLKSFTKDATDFFIVRHNSKPSRR
jgi:hypothetical protein